MKNFSTAFSAIISGQAFQYGNRPRPTRDWAILLVVAFVLVCVSAAWNAWTFFRVEHGETLSSAAPQAPTTTSTSALTNLEDLAQARATEESHYSTDYHFVDPSH